MGYLDNKGLAHLWEKIKDRSLPVKALTFSEYSALSDDVKTTGIYFVKPDPVMAGEIVNWAGYEWIVTNINGVGNAVLSFPEIYELTTFGNVTDYSKSNIAVKAKEFEDSLPEEDLKQAVAYIRGGIMAKIFPPSFNQVKTGYLTSNARRVRTLNGESYPYYTLDTYTTSLAYGVNADGSTTNSLSKSGNYGFVPFVVLKKPKPKITLYINGSEIPLGADFTMDDVQDLLDEKQYKLTGTEGQIVGFDEDGDAVAQDMPSSSGGGYVYSTKEQVIGTWIDGRPLYRKTLYEESPVSNGSANSFLHNIKSIGTIVKLFGAIRGKRNGELSSFWIPIPNIYSSSTIGGMVAGSNNISVWLSSGSDPNYYDCPMYVTIEYTKTTDPATITIPQSISQQSYEAPQAILNEKE